MCKLQADYDIVKKTIHTMWKIKQNQMLGPFKFASNTKQVPETLLRTNKKEANMDSDRIKVLNFISTQFKPWLCSNTSPSSSAELKRESNWAIRVLMLSVTLSFCCWPPLFFFAMSIASSFVSGPLPFCLFVKFRIWSSCWRPEECNALKKKKTRFSGVVEDLGLALLCPE